MCVLVASLVFWFLNYQNKDFFYMSKERQISATPPAWRHYGISIDRGDATVVVWTAADAEPGGLLVMFIARHPSIFRLGKQHYGLSRHGSSFLGQTVAIPGKPFHEPPPTWIDEIKLPLWLIALLAAIYPLIQLRSWFRKRREMRQGLCGRCVYDLRAHQSGARCPECGTPVGSTSSLISPAL
jgi:hypothetical protein